MRETLQVTKVSGAEQGTLRCIHRLISSLGPDGKRVAAAMLVPTLMHSKGTNIMGVFSELEAPLDLAQ